MKIAVATNDLVHVTGHVGRCKAFLIYEVCNGTIVDRTILENTFTRHARGEGHDHHHHHHHHGNGTGRHHQDDETGDHDANGGGPGRLLAALKGCSHLVFTSAGVRLIDSFKLAGIEPVPTAEPHADTAVRLLINGTLERLADGACDEK